MKSRTRATLQKLKLDFIHYAAKCLKVRVKEGAIRPLVLNAAQLYIHAALEAQLQETGRVRALILKGRQQGCSTYVQGRFYWKVTQGQGQRAFILTHLDEATKNVYQIVRRFHDNCPAALRPRTSSSNARELTFDRLDSGYHIGTARSSGVGRSNTIQYFHGSEVAFWPNAEEHVAGILQAVPDLPGTEIILESTSAGAMGLFHVLCQAATAGSGAYKFIFVPWFWQDEYRKLPPVDFAPTLEEKDYAETHALDHAQLCWRRAKLIELGGIWAFRREYPATAAEAFHADNPGALWSRAMIDKNRCRDGKYPLLKRTVVAVDPAVTSQAGSDETGIIVVGIGMDDHAYVLADLSGRYTPGQWAAVVVKAFHQFDADRVVAEVNQGGQMVEYTLRTVDERIPYKAVRASRGKVARAEPVAALDEQGRIHHVGIFPQLEDQMCGFDPGDAGKKCDRVDARVWAVTELMLARHPPSGPKVWM
jgi:hypothetical protein